MSLCICVPLSILVDFNALSICELCILQSKRASPGNGCLSSSVELTDIGAVDPSYILHYIAAMWRKLLILETMYKLKDATAVCTDLLQCVGNHKVHLQQLYAGDQSGVKDGTGVQFSLRYGSVLTQQYIAHHLFDTMESENTVKDLPGFVAVDTDGELDENVLTGDGVYDFLQLQAGLLNKLNRLEYLSKLH